MFGVTLESVSFLHIFLVAFWNHLGTLVMFFAFVFIDVGMCFIASEWVSSVFFFTEAPLGAIVYVGCYEPCASF